MRAASETHRATRNHVDVDKYNRKEKRGLMLFRLLFQLKKEKDQQACNSLQEKKVSCENSFRNTTGGEWQKSGVNAVTRTVWLFSRRGNGAGVC